jgi:hypothetical protein
MNLIPNKYCISFQSQIKKIPSESWKKDIQRNFKKTRKWVGGEGSAQGR